VSDARFAGRNRQNLLPPRSIPRRAKSGEMFNGPHPATVSGWRRQRRPRRGTSIGVKRQIDGLPDGGISWIGGLESNA